MLSAFPAPQIVKRLGKGRQAPEVTTASRLEGVLAISSLSSACQANVAELLFKKSIKYGILTSNYPRLTP
jgi:hypothetical protein